MLPLILFVNYPDMVLFTFAHKHLFIVSITENTHGGFKNKVAHFINLSGFSFYCIFYKTLHFSLIYLHVCILRYCLREQDVTMVIFSCDETPI